MKMDKLDFALNPHFVRYEQLLLQLHDLIAAGEGNSDAADLIRDEMEGPERHLSRAEMDLLDGLSADLYMLSGQEIFEPLELGQTQQSLQAALRRVWQIQDMEALLRLLRKGPSNLTAEEMASLRSYAYEQIGVLESAVRFKRMAVPLAPSPARTIEHQVTLLPLLYELGHIDEAEALCQKLANDSSASADVRYVAVNYWYRVFSYREYGLESNVANIIVPLVVNIAPRVSDPLRVTVYAFLGDRFAQIGNRESARIWYEKALKFGSSAELTEYLRRGLYLLNLNTAGSSTHKFEASPRTLAANKRPEFTF
jgi:tetratricopeptide (TPR) repeat protein